MVSDSLAAMLSQGAAIYPGMDLFEPMQADKDILMRSILEKCGRLIEKAGESRETFESWLNKVLKHAGAIYSLAFYGKAVYAGPEEPPSDIDLLIIVKDERAFCAERGMIDDFSFHKSPGGIHPQLLFGNGTHLDTIAGWKRFCVVNHLLAYPSRPDPNFISAVARGRELVMMSPFFNGGLGELLTYAANKVLEGGEEAYFDPPDRHLLERRCFVSKYGFELAPLHPAEFNGEVRFELGAKFSDDEIRKIAIAGMRRLRVKKEMHGKLADRFVSNLPPRRCY